MYVKKDGKLFRLKHRLEDYPRCCGIDALAFWRLEDANEREHRDYWEDEWKKLTPKQYAAQLEKAPELGMDVVRKIVDLNGHGCYTIADVKDGVADTWMIAPVAALETPEFSTKRFDVQAIVTPYFPNRNHGGKSSDRMLTLIVSKRPRKKKEAVK